jgi:hypothetical protein
MCDTSIVLDAFHLHRRKNTLANKHASWAVQRKITCVALLSLNGSVVCGDQISESLVTRQFWPTALVKLLSPPQASAPIREGGVEAVLIGSRVRPRLVQPVLSNLSRSGLRLIDRYATVAALRMIPG